MRRFLVVVVLLATACVSFATQPESVEVRVAERADVKAALAAIRQHNAQVLQDQVELTEIAAPPMKEQRRAEAVRARFQALGLRNIRIDRAGNVLGDRPGRAAHPHLVLAAHLDTVFPEGTNVKVAHQGVLLKAPGIADDGRGLAAMLEVARALDTAKVQTDGTITFVANVGEEGLGDLRGVREIFDRTLKGQADAFVSIDGGGLDITNGGVGSNRYRVTFKGPGGHSFGDFGMVNPIHALGRAIATIAEFRVPSSPKTTFNVGRIGGGTSINSISYEAWMEMDMRSEDAAQLEKVDVAFRKAIERALADENQRWNEGTLKVSVDLVGKRPAGRTPDASPIVQTAIAVTRQVGAGNPELGSGSTDANYPMSLGIPAITIGGGGVSRGAHSLAESFDPTDSSRGIERALLLTVALVTNR